jgi:hypothetical protein
VPTPPIFQTRRNEGTQSPITAVAVLLIGIGVFAFFAVLLRLGELPAPKAPTDLAKRRQRDFALGSRASGEIERHRDLTGRHGRLQFTALGLVKCKTWR